MYFKCLFYFNNIAIITIILIYNNKGLSNITIGTDINTANKPVTNVPILNFLLYIDCPVFNKNITIKAIIIIYSSFN